MFERFIVQLANCWILVLGEVMDDRILIVRTLVEQGNSVAEEDERRFLRRTVQSHQLTVERLDGDCFQVLLEVIEQVADLHLQFVAFITVLLRWKGIR